MLIELFEIACNHALEHDPITMQNLQKLQGKSMALTVKTINQSITVCPSPEGIELSRDIPENVDVVLTASPSAMLKISRDGMEDADLQPGELEISGDPIIGQRFAKIISEFDINWQDLLAEQIGDSPARVITLAAEQTLDIAQQSRVQIHNRLIHFIKEELGVTADHKEVDSFLDDVDTLRADTDRLKKRLKRLRTTVTK